MFISTDKTTTDINNNSTDTVIALILMILLILLTILLITIPHTILITYVHAVQRKEEEAQFPRRPSVLSFLLLKDWIPYKFESSE